MDIIFNKAVYTAFVPPSKQKNKFGQSFNVIASTGSIHNMMKYFIMEKTVQVCKKVYFALIFELHFQFIIRGRMTRRGE